MWAEGVMRHLAVLLTATLGVSGCGQARGTHAQAPPAPDNGGSGGTPAGGTSSGGSDPVGGGGQRNPGGPLSVNQCDVGAIRAPLVRYSSVDLEWTMQELFGEAGGPLGFDDSDRSENGEARSAGPIFVQDLV